MPAWAASDAFPFGTLLSLLTGRPSDAEVLETAAAMAPVGARWQAILPVPMPERVACQWGEAPDHALAVDHAVRREDATTHLATMRRKVQGMVANAGCDVGESPARTLPDSLLGVARRARLVVMAAPCVVPPEAPSTASWFSRILMQSGRPSLVLPPGARLRAAPSRALVCWSAAPQATRALHDAMHALPPQCHFHLVSVVGSSGARADAVSAASLAPAAVHVRRHGRDADVELVDSQGGPPEETLLRIATEIAADIIVMGAYGHPRYVEFVFGGTTQALLQRSRTALFMAH
ncbi:universal stress protein [Luteibacter sp. UNCMF331Sha3.1]|uniref:universal stress protein n=1 Tax=Luteibacter sp. UNCMF331Sha3.1 TaxID=1502760 RepID=UPI00147C14F7|nr:universal stress protein [Luteibacter sp. UNCMF331Sha3.1]